MELVDDVRVIEREQVHVGVGVEVAGDRDRALDEDDVIRVDGADRGEETGGEGMPLLAGRGRLGLVEEAEARR